MEIAHGFNFFPSLFFDEVFVAVGSVTLEERSSAVRCLGADVRADG